MNRRDPCQPEFTPSRKEASFPFQVHDVGLLKAILWCLAVGGAAIGILIALSGCAGMSAPPKAWAVAAMYRDRAAANGGVLEFTLSDKSNSMAPRWKGLDVIHIHTVPLTPAVIGKPVSFAALSSGPYGRTCEAIFHRCIGKVAGLELYITKGDNCDFNDPFPMSAENFIGVGDNR